MYDYKQALIDDIKERVDDYDFDWSMDEDDLANEIEDVL